MNKFKMTKSIILLTSLFSLAACQGQESTTEGNTEGIKPSTPSSEVSTTVEIKDMLGRDVTVKKDAKERVICLGAGALRLYSYVGDVNKLVGVEDIDRNVGANPFKDVSRPYYDLHEAHFSTLPSCGKGGPQAQKPEHEKILSCNPSLIITEYTDVNVVNDLQNKTGVPVVALSYGPKSVFDQKIKDSISILGKVLDQEEKADTLNSYIAFCEEELKMKVSNTSEVATPLYIGCLGNWGRQDIYSTSSNYILFNVSNIPNALDSTVQLQEGKIEEEKFVSLNPSKIVLDSAGIERFRETFKQKRDTFMAMDAFKNSEIYIQIAFNAYYTNLEVALMDAYYLASISYPETYKDFNLTDKYNEITKNFLGKEFYSEIAAKPLSYGGYQKISNIEEFMNAK